MKYMTWGEFKNRVEMRGVTDEMQVAYIDFDGHDTDVEVCIPSTSNGSASEPISISN